MSAPDSSTGGFALTEAELRVLVEQGESFTVEFKGEERGRLNDTDLVLAAVCMANGRGGRLVVGVEDDRRVTGATARHEGGTTDPNRVAVLISNRTQPSLSVRVSVHTLDEKDVVVIDIPDIDQIVGTTDGRYERRTVGGDGRPRRCAAA